MKAAGFATFNLSYSNCQQGIKIKIKLTRNRNQTPSLPQVSKDLAPHIFYYYRELKLGRRASGEALGRFPPVTAALAAPPCLRTLFLARTSDRRLPSPSSDVTASEAEPPSSYSMISTRVLESQDSDLLPP